MSDLDALDRLVAQVFGSPNGPVHELREVITHRTQRQVR